MLRHEICSVAFPEDVFACASVEKQPTGPTAMGLEDFKILFLATKEAALEEKNGMKCTTICKGQSYTNVQTEILILNPDDCNIDYDDILEEGRRDLDDDLSNEEIEELEFVILRPSSAKRVKNLLKVSEKN
ncbi:hypothetical protein ILUMI_14172 [Ignelater luminosus]|uniref:Uncharacterized protein n=1 Tax=Ignelater luminosus TaxID=2038154 RepID=A0A8K0CVD2_IGNLU|nr:hypothetical protein ILUMI_14172 [Ignelater luminosus]